MKWDNWEMYPIFFKLGVLKNLALFARKHLLESPFGKIGFKSSGYVSHSSSHEELVIICNSFKYRDKKFHLVTLSILVYLTN